MTARTAFEDIFGFRREDVILANWRTTPFSRWSFQNVSELVPSAFLSGRTNGEESAPLDAGRLLGRTVSLSRGPETIAAFLERSHTDALSVMKAGRFAGDWLAPHMAAGNRHLVFSISKSITAILAGILEGEGRFDPEAPVIGYAPEAAGSAYDQATARHVLDMTVSLDFEEAYLEPGSPFARYRQAMLWNPGGNETLSEFLFSLKALPEPHGEVFRYRSPNSDLLGVLLERASGQRIPDLLETRLREPLGLRSGLSTTVDAAGTARTAGGMSFTPRDLARIGEMMRQGGVADGRRIVPEAWVHDTVTAGSRSAWQRSDFVKLFPEGRYRNKWYQSGKGYFCGIGIHGQWLVIDPASQTVIVKMASQPEPVDEPLDLDNIALFEALFSMI